MCLIKIDTRYDTGVSAVQVLMLSWKLRLQTQVHMEAWLQVLMEAWLQTQVHIYS